MRLRLKENERRPNPEPVQTDDRKVVLTGIVLWLLALGGMLVLLTALIAADRTQWLWTALFGVGIGLVLLVFAQRRRD